MKTKDFRKQTRILTWQGALERYPQQTIRNIAITKAHGIIVRGVIAEDIDASVPYVLSVYNVAA